MLLVQETKDSLGKEKDDKHSYNVEVFLNRMIKGEKIIDERKVKPINTRFGVIDLTDLNDIQRYNTSDGCVRLARDLQIAHYLRLIRVEFLGFLRPVTKSSI